MITPKVRPATDIKWKLAKKSFPGSMVLDKEPIGSGSGLINDRAKFEFSWMTDGSAILKLSFCETNSLSPEAHPLVQLLSDNVMDGKTPRFSYFKKDEIQFYFEWCPEESADKRYAELISDKRYQNVVDVLTNRF